MNWNKNRSVALSKACAVAFALLLAVIDIRGVWIASFLSLLLCVQQWHLLILIYLCSLPAWAALWCLWRLLSNLGQGAVFSSKNVRLMRLVSWECFAAALLCLVGAVWAKFLTLIVLAAAAAFMGLIVRIVKNAFEQAISMKDELDFTI